MEPEPAMEPDLERELPPPPPPAPRPRADAVEQRRPRQAFLDQFMGAGKERSKVFCVQNVPFTSFTVFHSLHHHPGIVLLLLPSLLLFLNVHQSQ